MAKHFHHFKTTSGIPFSLEEDCFLPRNRAISSYNWRYISPKVIGTDGFCLTRELGQFVCFCSDVESYRRCQHFTMLLGGTGTLGIE